MLCAPENRCDALQPVSMLSAPENRCDALLPVQPFQFSVLQRTAVMPCNPFQLLQFSVLQRTAVMPWVNCSCIPGLLYWGAAFPARECSWGADNISGVFTPLLTV